MKSGVGENGQVDEARPREYAIGQIVPGTRYTVQRVLDHGGQAIVYEVENAIGKRLVLKVVRPTVLGQEFSKQLEDEAKILVRLEHPNIVTAHELGVTAEDPPRVFIVMELLRGLNARQMLQRRRRLDLVAALEIGASVAEALAHTHAMGVVHLDVKPTNVFVHVRPNGTHVVKLLDFGFMRVLGPHGFTRSLSGTPTYGAPEQLLQEPVSARTDIYSLGLVLYELLAGRRPFALDDGIMALVAARLSRPAIPLSRWALVPPEVEEIVMRCLDRRPDLRPAKASEVARVLRDAHARALRRLRVGDPYVTVESLVGLVRETRMPEAQSPLPVAIEERLPENRDEGGAVASNERLDLWFREALEGEFEPPMRPRASRVLIGAAGAAAALSLAGAGYWGAAHGRPPAPAIAPVTLTSTWVAPPTSPPPPPPTASSLAEDSQEGLPARPAPPPRPTRAPTHQARVSPPAARAPVPSASADPLLEWLERSPHPARTETE